MYIVQMGTRNDQAQTAGHILYGSVNHTGSGTHNGILNPTPTVTERLVYVWGIKLHRVLPKC